MNRSLVVLIYVLGWLHVKSRKKIALVLITLPMLVKNEQNLFALLFANKVLFCCSTFTNDDDSGFSADFVGKSLF